MNAYPTFTLLALAILSLWLSGNLGRSFFRRNAWLLIGSASLGVAVFSGIVQPIGLAGIAVWVAATFAFSRPQAGRLQLAVSAAAIFIISAALMLHRVPGFNNPRVIAGAQFSSDAIPFTLYLNYDKTLIGLFLLGWCHSRITKAREWRAMFVAAAPWAAALIAVMMVLSVAAGYVRFEPKLPRETWLWLGVNLLSTCVAEEAFFRGFVQAQLARLGKNTPHGSIIALIVAAILFGLAHAAGGVLYVALATIAGLGYGWIYRRTGRIEASILTHFTLNTVHFLAFTYPALQSAF